MEKKSVGIITYHKHYNYGTMLQAFSLQKAVELMGYNSEIIDFYESHVLSRNEKQRLYRSRMSYYLIHFIPYTKKMLSFFIGKINSRNINEKKRRFDSFYDKNIKISSQKYSDSDKLKKDVPIYDIYVVGSDQTWNPNVGGNPEAFYLSFAPREKKRVSYAPSVSVNTLTKEQEKRMKELLTNVQVLSCREKDGAKLLERLTGRSVENVLDPTFLLERDEWDNFAIAVKHPERYILQYLLGTNKDHRKLIKRIAKKLDLPIVCIPCVPMDMHDRRVIKCWGGPAEFLTLIKNAELVCTDSFHGTAFSINYRTPVYSFYKSMSSDKKSENSRLSNLYEVFGMPSRVITDFQDLPKDIDIPFNYDIYEKNICRQIKRSKNYLKDIL